MCGKVRFSQIRSHIIMCIWTKVETGSDDHPGYFGHFLSWSNNYVPGIVKPGKHDWFLKIAFVCNVGMSVCVCVCVCPPPKAILLSRYIEPVQSAEQVYCI